MKINIQIHYSFGLLNALSLSVALLLAGCKTSPEPAQEPASLPTPKPAATLACHAAGSPAWQLLGEQRWPLDTSWAGTPIGGLSSIDYNPADDSYYLVSDDRSAKDSARWYQARIRYNASGLQQVSITGQQYLQTPAGTPYPSSRTAAADTAVPDPEALRLLPGGRSVVWSSEGDFARGFGPALQQAGLDGSWQKTWPLPALLQGPLQPETGRGPRNNMTLEGIAISDDQRSLWLAMEGALRQDGPLPRRGQIGGPLRITQYDLASQQPVRQIAYIPGALPKDNLLLPLIAINGVSEILADGPDHLLVLERAYVLGAGFSARLYRINTQEASDTLAIDALQDAAYTPAHKELLLDFAQLGLRTVDNLEGMTWGPRLASGERVLLLVSDNNFNPAQVTQFLALVETPACASASGNTSGHAGQSHRN
ncbi:esterase-like activity of phytase family protein [Comamonas sp. 23]|uniref:esterase-like activity of phytase family protein n=1 Tax=Comamonas sp. 23 TaxID=3415008 RepID=UPI003C6FED59